MSPAQDHSIRSQASLRSWRYGACELKFWRRSREKMAKSLSLFSSKLRRSLVGALTIPPATQARAKRAIRLPCPHKHSHVIIMIMLKRLYEQAEEFMFALIAVWRSRPVRSSKASLGHQHSLRQDSIKLSIDIKFPPPPPPPTVKSLAP